MLERKIVDVVAARPSSVTVCRLMRGLVKVGEWTAPAIYEE